MRILYLPPGSHSQVIQKLFMSDKLKRKQLLTKAKKKHFSHRFKIDFLFQSQNDVSHDLCSCA
jgi:hypothetical protein